MELRQVVLSWVLPSGTPSRTVLNLETVVSFDQNVADIRAAFEAFKPMLSNTTTIQYPVTAKVFDSVTGNLVRVDAAGAVANTVGTAANATMPDAVQGLIQYTANAFIGNRRLKGRTFVPGISSAQTTAGNASVALVAALATLGNALANAGLRIWSRPSSTPARAGVASSIGPVTGSPEFAVLRRRRNRIVV